MKLNILKTIQKEELSKYGELPEWINPFLQGLNQFISSVGQAIRGKLTFEENFQCVTKNMAFSHGVATKVTTGSTLKVIGVIPTYAGGLIIDKFGWVYNSDGTIGVTFYFVTGTSATCKIIILLG